MAGRRKTKTAKALRGTKPRLAANLTRADRALAALDAVKASGIWDSAETITSELSPIRIDVKMQKMYALELLGQLRVASKPSRGECHLIMVDCPTTIYLSEPARKRLISELEIAFE